MRVVKSSTALGKRIETIRIIPESEPEITEEKIWSLRSVREVCISYNLYTMGDCEEYGNMLNFVEDNEFTLKNLYKVAEDICNHSPEQTIENVMFLLNKDAVKTFYHISK